MKAIQLEEEVHNFCLNNVKNKENLKEEGKGRREPIHRKVHCCTSKM